MGIKTIVDRNENEMRLHSEKPPHHMGIKTVSASAVLKLNLTLKNLPTTWGLRRLCS